MFCGTVHNQSFSTSTEVLFHSFLIQIVWYNVIPSSSQSVETIMWWTPIFRVLILCLTLPPSSWCLLWNQSTSETTSCFEAKCNERNLSNLCMFLFLFCLIATDCAIEWKFTCHRTHNSSRPPTIHLQLQYTAAVQFLVIVVECIWINNIATLPEPSQTVLIFSHVHYEHSSDCEIQKDTFIFKIELDQIGFWSAVKVFWFFSQLLIYVF